MLCSITQYQRKIYPCEWKISFAQILQCNNAIKTHVRPNGLVGCKVPTDLMKISVKEAIQNKMGFCFYPTLKSNTAN